MAPKPGRCAIFEQLRADGVRCIFGNPGTVEQGFLDALSEYPDIRYILALQESVAVGMADGYARATGRPTFVQLHTGVGLGNGIGMLYQAMQGHAPLVVIAGEAGLRYHAMDAQMAADLVGMAEPVTKWATMVMDSTSILRVLRRATKIAATPPMGPVFVCLPMDVLDAPNDEPVVPTSIPVTRVMPEPEQVAAAAQLLGAADRPLIIVGDGVAFSGAEQELTRVAELLGAEVWGANSSQVNMSADHPLYRGLLGHMFGEHSRTITSKANAVLVVGTYLFPEVFPALSDVFAPATPVVHVDLDANAIAKNFPVDMGLVADPKLTLAQLADALARTMNPSQTEAAASRVTTAAATKQREQAAQREADQATKHARPLHPSQLMAELGRQLPPDAVIFDEALTASPELTRYIPPTTPGHYFQTRGGSLGVGIPGAIGLKLAYPDKTVVGFTGDGGSLYTIQALWTAAHHRIGAKFVVCNNGTYQLLKDNLAQYWRERVIPEHAFPTSFDLCDPDIRFDRLAEAMGVSAARIESPEQVAPAVQAALATDSPFLIDAVLGAQIAPGLHAHRKGGQ